MCRKTSQTEHFYRKNNDQFEQSWSSTSQTEGTISRIGSYFEIFPHLFPFMFMLEE